MIETVPSGTVLHGRYRIERVLGSGGFGHVYLAIDQTTNQQYAIKEYLVTGAGGQEQLKHEATVLSHLHHPNLPAFQDAFIEHGRYYVVLNYIEGNDLTDLVRIAKQRNEPIPIAQIINWVLAICDAVIFLHSQQPTVIHRDIKPDNIRIMPNGTAVLVDLGNAKAAADGARTLFFIRHQGTPGYAPPEQYPGGSGTDARSDVYALGGTLYFALTAHEPPSVSVRNQSLQQNQPTLPSLQEHLANNPPEESPEARAARQFRLGVSKPEKPAPRHSRHIAQLGTLRPDTLRQLNAIIQKSMALKPKDRYQYVADFAHDLKKVAAALPAPPPPAPPPTPPKRPIDPHSTQPDLPGIYDAIQEAKEQAGQGPSGGIHTGPQPGPSYPASAQACPRCGTPLAPKAVFCPRCGSSLAPPNAMSPAQGKGSDMMGEETLLFSPTNIKGAVATHPGKQFSHSTSRPIAQQSQAGNLPGIAPTPTTTQVPAPAVSQWQTSQGRLQQAPITGQQSASFPDSWIKPQVLIALVILLIILIAIAVVILINQQHARGTLIDPLAQAQLLFHLNAFRL